MTLTIRAGSLAIEGPIGYDIVDSEVTMDGLKYSNFAEVTATKSKEVVLYTIAEKLPVDLRITLKKKKKFLGVF